MSPSFWKSGGSWQNDVPCDTTHFHDSLARLTGSVDALECVRVRHAVGFRHFALWPTERRADVSTKTRFSASRFLRLCTQLVELLGQNALVVLRIVPHTNAALETGPFGA